MLPAIYRIYGLRWPDITDMPRGERVELLEDLAALISGGHEEVG